MEKNYQFLRMDINKPINRNLTAIQYDNKSRYILVSVFSNFVPYDLTYTTVKIYGIKGDKTVFFNNAKIVDAKAGKFEIDLTEQCLAVEGDVEIQILILGANEERLSSNSFILNVKKNIIEPLKITSQDEWNVLIEGLKSLSEYDVYKNNVTRHDSEIKENLKKICTLKNEVNAQLDDIVFLNIANFEKQEGDTSDSQRINRALDILRRDITSSTQNNIKSGGRLYFPSGMYEIDETIILDPNIEIEGIGPVLTTSKEHGDNLDGKSNTILKWIGEDNSVMIETAPFNPKTGMRISNPPKVVPTDDIDNLLQTRVNIKNISLLGKGNQVGIKLYYSPLSIIENVGIQNVSTGIFFKNCWGSTFRGVNILSHGQGIVAWHANEGVRVEDSYINGYGFAGTPEAFTGDLDFKSSNDIHASGVGTWKTGLYFKESSGIKTSGVILEHWHRSIYTEKNARNSFNAIHIEDYYECGFNSNEAVFQIDTFKSVQNTKNIEHANGGIFIFENCVHTSYIRNLWQSNLSDLGNANGGYKVNKCLCVNATGTENSIIIEGYRPLKGDRFFKQIVLKDIGGGSEGKPNTYYVDSSLGDDNNFGCTVNFPLKTLQAAINRGAETIYVNGNYIMTTSVDVENKDVEIIFKSGATLTRSDSWAFIKITNSKVKFTNLTHSLEANSLIKLDGINDITFESTSIKMNQQTSIFRTEYESCSISNVLFKKSNVTRIGVDERMYLIASGSAGKNAVLNVVLPTHDLVRLTDDSAKYKITSI